MPTLGPVQTNGVRFLTGRTDLVSRGSFKAGDVGVVTRGGVTSADTFTHIDRITGPLDLMKPLGLVCGDAVAGQTVKVLLCGDMDAALAHYGARLEAEQALVANVAGALCAGKPGQRVVAYTRCECLSPSENRPERSLIPVFFDGVSGFGPHQ